MFTISTHRIRLRVDYSGSVEFIEVREVTNTGTYR
jgi:hypothetical protein